MPKSLWVLFLLYFPAAGGYGGWCGQLLWTDWILWSFLLPPVAWSCYPDLKVWRVVPPSVGRLVGAAVAGAAIGAVAVFYAGVMAEITGRLWNDPATRAAAGAAISLGAGVAALVIIQRKVQEMGSRNETPAHAPDIHRG
jgi:hypothetical protein